MMTNVGTDLSGIKTNIEAKTNPLFDAAGEGLKSSFNQYGKIYDENNKLIEEKKNNSKELLDEIKKANQEQLDIRERSIRFKGADEAVGDSQDYIKGAYHDKLNRQAEGLNEVIDGRVDNYQDKRINEINKQLIENELTIRTSNLEASLADKKLEILNLNMETEVLRRKYKNYKKLYKAALIMNKVFWPLLGIGLGALVGYLIVLFG